MTDHNSTDIWKTLEQWADQRLGGLVVTLVDAPAPEAGLVGRMAVMAGPGAPARGPLTEAPFWPADMPALREAVAEAPPEGGRLVACGQRRYLAAALTRSRSALVLGGGHVGGCLARLLRFLEFEVTLMDDRPEFLRGPDDGVTALAAPFARLTEMFSGSAMDAVVIVTRGHAQDTACLRQILSWPLPPPYLGMIGSRRRAKDTLDMLAEEHFPPERLARVHTPVGLQIGAQTPAEIAVSIAAEIIQALGAAAAGD